MFQRLWLLKQLWVFLNFFKQKTIFTKMSTKSINQKLVQIWSKNKFLATKKWKISYSKLMRSIRRLKINNNYNMNRYCQILLMIIRFNIAILSSKIKVNAKLCMAKYYRSSLATLRKANELVKCGIRFKFLFLKQTSNKF